MASDERRDEHGYWASRPAALGPDQPDDGFVHELQGRIRGYYEALEQNGLLEVWQRMHAAYFGLEDSGAGTGQHASSSVQFGGDFDERVFAKSNHFRSIAQYLVTTTVSNRPEFSPRAINSESTSMAQVPVARDVLEWYMREKEVEDRLVSVMERAILYGRAYFWGNWDPELGPMGQPLPSDDNDNPDEMHAGDLYCRALSPMNVVSDVAREMHDQDWYCVHVPSNKWDLAEQYGSNSELGESVRDALEQVDGTAEHTWGDWSGPGASERADGDLVDVWHFMHVATPALPEGRYVITAGDGIVLFDGPYPYDDLNVIPASPADFLETGFGYSNMFDLVGLQDMYDSCLSALITSIDAFGVANIAVPEGSDIGVEEVRDGLNLIYYPQGTEPPKALDLLHIDPAIGQFMESIKGDMETIPGVNSVARGEPAPNLKSGAALALVQAQAVQFNSGLTRAFTKLIERVGTLIVRMLKRYAKVPRLAMVTGEHESEALREFTGDDLSEIDRVVVDSGNALARTTAGKVQLAEWLLDKGLVKHPEQLSQVLRTGRFDPITKADDAHLLCIRQENERLKKGGLKVVDGPDGREVEGLPVIFTDPPHLHIPEHAAEAASTEVRNDPDRVAAIMAHTQHHMRVWRNTDPGLLDALGYPRADGSEPGSPPMGELDPKQGPGGDGPEALALPDGGPMEGESVEMPGDGPPPVPGTDGGGGGPRMPNMPKPPAIPAG